MPHWNSLKASFAFGVQPGNIQRVRVRLAFDCLQSFQMLAIVIGSFSVNQSRMRKDRFLRRQNAFDTFKSNVHLCRTVSGGFLIFQEDGQHLDSLQRFRGRVGQLQSNIRSVIDESMGKAVRFFISHALAFCWSFGSRLFEATVKERQNGGSALEMSWQSLRLSIARCAPRDSFASPATRHEAVTNY